MTGLEIRTRLKDGRPVYGTAMLSQSILWPQFLASTGMDFVFIDSEHTPLGRETLSSACHTYRSKNLVPIVRIPSPDPYLASMSLDGGAAGIIAPYIESVDQVRQLVGAVKYKPLKGEKLQRFLNGKQELEPELLEYLNKTNSNNILIVNIESTPALDALDEILVVDGLDGILVGPHDLSCSLGIPEQYHHPLFSETIESIVRRARSHRVGVGIHVWDDVGFDREIAWAKLGANLIVHSNDHSLLASTLRTGISKIKTALGEELSDESKTNHVI